MPDIPAAAEAVVDLRPLQYQASVNALRSLLDGGTSKVPFMRVAVRTPADEFVEVRLRRDDVYIVAFKGADSWYSFAGERGAWGQPSGTGANYNDLGRVGTIAYDDLKRLGELECARMELAIEGVAAIKSGSNPRIIAQKLRSLLPAGQQTDAEAA